VTRKYRGRYVVCASSVCALFAISPRDTRWDLYLVLCSVSHSLTGISGCDRARRTGLNRTHIKIYIAFSFLARVTVLNRCAERTILWCNICTNNNLFPDRLYLQGVVYKQYLYSIYTSHYQSFISPNLYVHDNTVDGSTTTAFMAACRLWRLRRGVLMSNNGAHRIETK
jgi:hypothetical protein